MSKALLLLIFLALPISGCDDPYWWPNERFDSAIWKATKEGERYRFANDIVQRKILNGLSVDEVHKLLGDPGPYTGLELNQNIKIDGQWLHGDPPKFYSEDYILTDSDSWGEVYLLTIKFTEQKIVYAVIIRHAS